MTTTTTAPRKRSKREFIGGKYRVVPKFNIEPCMYEGDTWFIVRCNGRIVTTISAQDTRQQARNRAAAYAWAQRKRLADATGIPF